MVSRVSAKEGDVSIRDIKIKKMFRFIERDKFTAIQKSEQISLRGYF